MAVECVKQDLEFTKIRYVESQEIALKLIDQFEIETLTKFVHYKGKSLKNFGKTDWKIHQGKIFWEENYDTKFDRIDYDGIPYMSFGKVVLDCHYGKDRDVRKKSAVKRAGIQRRKHHASVKVGCNAQISLREIVKFPEYQVKKYLESGRRKYTRSHIRDVEEHSTCKRLLKTVNKDLDEEHARRKASKALRKAVDGGIDIMGERRIYIHFPKAEDHDHHMVDENAELNLPVDRRITSQIHSLVAEGVTDPLVMKSHLNAYVENNPFNIETNTTLSPSNRRFYPTLKDIKNHMYQAKLKLRLSKIDQENIEKMVSDWQQSARSDSFFFRPHVDRLDCGALSSTEVIDDKVGCKRESALPADVGNMQQKLLFVHQTSWQRDLLEKYGNEVFLLEAIFRATRCGLPVYFMVVCTNVDYQVVGSFVTQDETQESVEEALRVLAEWNPQWRPNHAVTDDQKEEIMAIETVFPDCLVLLSDYHREEAWSRWLRKVENGVASSKKIILAHLKHIARAETETKYLEEVASLKRSKEWQDEGNAKFRYWAEMWLKEHKRWVFAYRKGRLLSFANADNGVEPQSPTFRQSFLKQHTRSTLSQIIKVLVEDYLPNQYQESYVSKNMKCSSQYRVYHEGVPDYLHNRPEYFVKHCNERLSYAQHFTENDIKESGGFFFVRSQSSPKLWHKVYFGDEDGGWPSCTCSDWQRFGMPCKHFFAILSLNSRVKWENFPLWYREASPFTMDRSVLVEPKEEIFVTEVADHCLEYSDSEFDSVYTLTDPTTKAIKTEHSEISECHKMLQRIKKKLLMVSDSSVIQETYSSLQSVVNRLDECILNKSMIGLPHNENGLSGKREMLTLRGASNADVSDFPFRKEKKRKISNGGGKISDGSLSVFLPEGSVRIKKNPRNLFPNIIDEQILILEAASF